MVTTDTHTQHKHKHEKFHTRLHVHQTRTVHMGRDSVQVCTLMATLCSCAMAARSVHDSVKHEHDGITPVVILDRLLHVEVVRLGMRQQ